MINPPSDPQNDSYWEQRYAEQQTGWDIGYPSTPLKAYFDQLDNKELSILIPGAGNAYEAEYAWKSGFTNLCILDIAEAPLQSFQDRIPDFPQTQILHEDFFAHEGDYDIIIEQTFFCSFYPSPENRKRYAEKMHALLRPGGKLVGLWFNFPYDPDRGRPPYGGTLKEYLSYFEPLFTVRHFDPCYNSIPERQGSEFFAILEK